MADRQAPARRLTTRVAAVALLLALGPTVPPALAQPAEGARADAATEARARAIGKHLRCLVCQNQSIDDSDAELAQDLRRLVRDRVRAGDSDQQIIGYIVSRYGDFVLLKPPFKPATYALWLGPLALAGLAGLVAVVYFRRRRPAEEAGALSAEEEARLTALLAAPKVEDDDA